MLVNPERGFYKHTEYNSMWPTLLAASTLASVRSAGQSVILRLFYLNAFTGGTNISQSVLADIDADLGTMRDGG